MSSVEELTHFWCYLCDTLYNSSSAQNSLTSKNVVTSVCTRHLAPSADLPSNTVRLSTVGSGVLSFHQTIANTKLYPVTSSRSYRHMQLGAPRPFAIKTTQLRHKLYYSQLIVWMEGQILGRLEPDLHRGLVLEYRNKFWQSVDHRNYVPSSQAGREGFQV